MTNIIETRDLTKIFRPNIVAVNQLSLTIKEGTIFSFLGPNGAGKTTTVRLLATLLIPTSGHASVLGKDIADKVNSQEIRKNIGILTDRPNLYLRLTARRNLFFFAKMYGLAHEEARRRIEELAKQFNLIERLDSPTGTYSKGMKQKLGILRAMIHSPPLLFLDEPTAGLDPIAQTNVRETIEMAAVEFDTTVFMTTHNLPEAERLADSIGIITNGKLITTGSTKDLQSQVSKSNQIMIRTTKELLQLSPSIKKIDGVLSLEFLEDNTTINATVSDMKEITPIIVKTLVDNGVSILEVRPITKSLEDIYRQIMDFTGTGLKENAA
ncbi:MAG: ABC transporter ATP-binding protein [Candidatus Thorarchaeota archaeon]